MKTILQTQLNILKKRQEILKTELSKRQKKTINKKSNYGIEVEKKKYEDLIKETFFDEKLFNEYVIKPKYTEKLGYENLSDGFTLYITQINSKVDKIWGDVSDIITRTFEKGGKRVFDKNLKPVKLAEIKDKRGVDYIIANQQRHFKNLAKDQSIQVMKTIADGREKGLSAVEIANLMRNKVKSLTESRALVISRTEIVRSHNFGQVQLLKEAGVERYDYITAGDDRVSDICRHYEMNNKDGYITELAGTEANPLPVTNSHPSCRCCIVVH